jgi:hypothetical protein
MSAFLIAKGFSWIIGVGQVLRDSKVNMQKIILRLKFSSCDFTATFRLLLLPVEIALYPPLVKMEQPHQPTLHAVEGRKKPLLHLAFRGYSATNKGRTGVAVF